MKTAVRLPIDVTNEVESVHAASWRTVPIQVPYNGSLTITAQVQRGNAVEMMLSDSNGVETLKADNHATYVFGFYAPEATTFQHTARVNQGTYYFVIRDRHLGILSSSSSDVSVKAHIEP